MVAAEGDVSDVRWTHPGPHHRAAVLTANGIGARARWEAKQGVDYATFRAALRDAKGGRLRQTVDDTAETTSTVTTTTSRASSSVHLQNRIDGDDATVARFEPLPSRQRYAFVPATVADDETVGGGTITECPVRLKRPTSNAPVVVTRWSRVGNPSRSPAKLALGRADGSVDIVDIRDSSRGASKANAPSPGSRFVLVASLKGHAGPVADVDWSASDDRLVTACARGEIRIWSATGRHESCDAKMADGTTEDANVSDPYEPELVWRCSRVVRLDGDANDGPEPSSDPTGKNEKDETGLPGGDRTSNDRVGKTRRAGSSSVQIHPVPGVRFHPLNSNVVFVAFAHRGFAILNASTGVLSVSKSDSKRFSRAAMTSAPCVDATGSFVFAGDASGRLVCARYSRADQNADGRRGFLSIAGGVSKRFSVPGGKPPDDVGNARLRTSHHRDGEHALRFAGRSEPPSGSEFPEHKAPASVSVVGVSVTSFAKAASGPAAYASFRCGAVRVYRTTFEKTSGPFTTSLRAKVSKGRLMKNTVTFIPVLTCRFPPTRLGVSGQTPFGSFGSFGSFVSIAPSVDPSSPVECAASAADGAAATYALPSRDGAPPMRSSALVAVADSAESADSAKRRGESDGGAAAAAARRVRFSEKPIATCASFDPSSTFLALGYRNGGVLLWRRA